MLIYDCICYNGEPIIEMRLELLYPVVDRIFITESWYTFTGTRKPALYKEINSSLFEKYADKIAWIVLESCVSTNPWQNEKEQRNAAYSHVVRASQHMPFICLVCDVDEIVNPNVVEAMKRDSGMYEHLTKPVALEMEFYYYSFRWRKKFKWLHPFAVNDLGISEDLDGMRLSGKAGCISNAGWHCSFFESVENIIRKVESFSHQEHNTESVKSLEHIRWCIENGIDLFSRGDYEDLIAVP